MPLNPLNHHYAMENPATVYDEEAMTALELAGRTTAKVNETVEAFNNLEANTNRHLEDQDKDIENQKTKVIPERISAEVQKHIDSGRFDQQVDTYAGNLQAELGQGVANNLREMQSTINQKVNPMEARLDTLLGSFQTGGTSGDAELVDMRTNPDGTVSASAGRALRDHYPYFVPQTVDAYNYQELLPTMNIYKPTVYRLNFATNDVNLPADSPFEKWPGGIGTLITSCPHQLQDSHLYMSQVLICDSGVYYRWSSNTYQVWKCITDSGMGVTSPETEIDAGNYQTYCPSIDDIEAPSFTRFVFGYNTTEFPRGFPFTHWPHASLVLLFTSSGHYPTGKMYRTQLLITGENIYYRYAAMEWNPWYCLTTKSAVENSLTVSNGESILAGVKTCYEKGVRKLIVQAGEYDIIQEYKTMYGSDYFENYKGYATSDRFDRGVWLENIEVVFAPGAIVRCHYYGENPDVSAYFSAFATGENVVIDGLELDSSNLRYGLHPDYVSTQNRSTMVIKNSILSHHKGGILCKAIGAGLGPHTDWIIENTIFRSNGIKEAVFSCHNTNANNKVKSRLTVRGCYIEGPGYFKFTHYGDSVEQTPVIVTGCSYVNKPLVQFENDLYHTENMALYAFNNEIREK